MATTNWEWEDVSKVDRNVTSRTPKVDSQGNPDGFTETFFNERRWTLVRTRKVDAAFAGDTDQGDTASSLTAYNGTRSTTINSPTFTDGVSSVDVFSCENDETTIIENGVEWNEQRQTWVIWFTYEV